MTTECYVTCLASGANGSGHSVLFSAENGRRPGYATATVTAEVESQISRVQGRCLINCGDCTQRTLMDNRVKLSKVSCLWLTSLAPHHTSGLAGILLSLSDLGSSALTVVGPPGTAGLLDVLAHFTNRMYPKLTIIEVGLEEEANQPLVIDAPPLRLSAYAVRANGHTVAIAGTVGLCPAKAKANANANAITAGTVASDANTAVVPSPSPSPVASLALVACSTSFAIKPDIHTQMVWNRKNSGSPLSLPLPLSLWSPISCHCNVNVSHAQKLCKLHLMAGLIAGCVADSSYVEQVKNAENSTVLHVLAPDLFPPLLPAVESAMLSLRAQVKQEGRPAPAPDTEQKLDVQTLQVGSCVRTRVMLTACLGAGAGGGAGTGLGMEAEEGDLAAEEEEASDDEEEEEEEDDNNSDGNSKEAGTAVAVQIFALADGHLRVAQRAHARLHIHDINEKHFNDSFSCHGAGAGAGQNGDVNELDIDVDKIGDGGDFDVAAPNKRPRLTAVPPPPPPPLAPPPPPPPPAPALPLPPQLLPLSAQASALNVLVTLLGTGCAQPSIHRNSSSSLLWLPGRNNNNTTTSASAPIGVGILLDCGEGTACQIFQSCSGNVEDYWKTLCSLRLVWISHHHADHSQGVLHLLEELQRAKTALLNKRKGCNSVDVSGCGISSEPLCIVASPDVIRYYEYAACVAGLEDTCTFIPIGSTAFTGCGALSPVGKLCADTLHHITSVPVQHCKDSYALVLHLTPIGGATKMHLHGYAAPMFKVVYSGDCRPSDNLIRVGMECDLLIHEATYNDSLAETAQQRRHSTASEAAIVGRRMHAKHVVLTHFSQRYNSNSSPAMSQRQEIAEGKGQGQEYVGMPWHGAGSGATACTLGYDLLRFSFPSQVADLPMRTHALAAAIEKEHAYSKARKGLAG